MPLFFVSLCLCVFVFNGTTPKMNFLDLIWLIPLFPAIGFVVNGVIGKRVPKTVVGVIASGAVLLSFIFSAGAVFQLLQLDPEHRSHTVKLYEWINAGAVRTTAGPHGAIGKKGSTQETKHQNRNRDG